MDEIYEDIINTVNSVTGLEFAGGGVGNHSIYLSLDMAFHLAKRAVSSIIRI